jgi:hypothetical protein
LEIEGVVKQLVKMQLKMPQSLRLRISFYNLRKFCEPSFPLDDGTVATFYLKFEKLVLISVFVFVFPSYISF